jgi:hypothetical protein
MFKALGQSANVIASGLNATASWAAKNAILTGYERRRDEWAFSATSPRASWSSSTGRSPQARCAPPSPSRSSPGTSGRSSSESGSTSSCSRSTPNEQL